NCKIAGMNINQAAQAVEKHLSAYFNKPSVRLTAIAPADVAETAWRSAQTAGLRPTSFQVSEPKDEGPALPVPNGPTPLLDQRHPEMAVAPPEHGGWRLKPPHGPIIAPVPGVPGELRQELLPPYVIGPPDILLIESVKGLVTQPVKGQHLVRP